MWDIPKRLFWLGLFSAIRRYITIRGRGCEWVKWEHFVPFTDGRERMFPSATREPGGVGFMGCIVVLHGMRAMTSQSPVSHQSVTSH